MEDEARVKPEGFQVREFQGDGLSCFDNECLKTNSLETAVIRRCFSQPDTYQYFCWFRVSELEKIRIELADVDIQVVNSPTNIKCKASPCHNIVKFSSTLKEKEIRRIRNYLLALLTNDRLVEFTDTSRIQT